MQQFAPGFQNFRVQITLPKNPMYFCQQICISMILVSEQLQRLWHPKVILIFHRYCYSKGIKRNTHCTLFLRHHKPSPSIIGSHITAIFLFLSQSVWPFNWCLFFSWMASQHFRYHYSAQLLSLSFFITSYYTAFESLISIFQVSHNKGFIVFYWTSCAIAVALQCCVIGRKKKTGCYLTCPAVQSLSLSWIAAPTFSKERFWGCSAKILKVGSSPQTFFHMSSTPHP